MRTRHPQQLKEAVGAQYFIKTFLDKKKNVATMETSRSFSQAFFILLRRVVQEFHWLIPPWTRALEQ